MELPTLETDRLRLAALTPDDAPRVAELAGERAVARNTESIPHPYSEEQAETFLRELSERMDDGEEAVFGIDLADEEVLIGAVGLHPEQDHERARLGYWIGRPYWGRGYATEAARAAVNWAFGAFDLQRVYAESFRRNQASCRVLEKLGMKREGRLRRHVKKWGAFVDLEIYGLLRDER